MPLIKQRLTSAAGGMRGIPAFYLAIGSNGPSGHFRNSLGYELLRQDAYSCQRKQISNPYAEGRKEIRRLA